MRDVMAICLLDVNNFPVDSSITVDLGLEGHHGKIIKIHSLGNISFHSRIPV